MTSNSSNTEFLEGLGAVYCGQLSVNNPPNRGFQSRCPCGRAETGTPCTNFTAIRCNKIQNWTNLPLITSWTFKCWLCDKCAKKVEGREWLFSSPNVLLVADEIEKLAGEGWAPQEGVLERIEEEVAAFKKSIAGSV